MKHVYGISISVTFGMTSSVSFYYTQAMQRLFFTQDYYRIHQVKDLWKVSNILNKS
jgi:hypothetical protein